MFASMLFSERIIFAPDDIGIPTMISLNGRLYIVYSDEIETLVTFTDGLGCFPKKGTLEFN